METDRKSIDTILCEALEIASPTERQSYLDRACGSDVDLRRQAERLIADHFEAGDFLEDPVAVVRAPGDEGLGNADFPDSTDGLPTYEKATVAWADTSEGPSSATEASATSGKLPRTFGDYELVEEIGRGGMGRVYRARQVSLNRTVALKVLLAGELASEEELRRFASEAKAAARLDHPGIVPVFDFGQSEGRHYFSMGFVQGQSLQQKLIEGPLAPREAAEMVRQVAEAIAYAHQQGVIHRDLKPANVLVDETGVPRVTDFGLAKRVEADGHLTATGQVLGTPSYMAPEQAAGTAESAGLAMDVYAMGATLYALLTGRPPFQAAGAVETLRQVVDRDPVPPRQLDPTIPRDLETICLKCLHKDPARRYGSAVELGADLGRYLEGAPILARPVAAWERGWKWVRRRPATAGLLLVGLVALVLLVAALVSCQYQGELERLLYFRRVHLAHVAWRDNDPLQAQQLLADCPAHLRGWGWEYVESLCRTGLERTFTSPFKSVLSVTHTSDGSRLVAGTVLGPIHVWDPHTGEEIFVLRGHEAHVESVAISADDRRLASASRDGTIRLWDLEERREVATCQDPSRWVYAVAFSPDGRLLASGSEDGAVRLWCAESGQPRGVLEGHQADVRAVAFSPDGKLIVSAGDDQIIRLWEVDRRRELVFLEGQASTIHGLAFSPDGRRLASGAEDGTIMLWTIPEGGSSLTIRAHTGRVSDVAFSPDGRCLASAGYGDRTVRVWDAILGREVLTFSGHTEGVEEVAFSPNGAYLASASPDFTAKIWRVRRPSETATLKGHSGRVTCVACSPTRPWLASSGEEGVVRLWDIRSGEPIRDLRGHEKSVNGLAFDPQGRFLASGGDDHRVILWDLDSGGSERVLAGHSGSVYDVAFSPPGGLLASASHDGTAILWDIEGKRPLATLAGHAGPVTSVDFSPCGKRVATASWDSTVKLWDAASGGERVTLDGHRREVLCVAFSPDGRRVASASRDGTLKLWSARNGRETRTMPGHTGAATCVAFDSVGKRLASTGWDGTVKLWDVATGHEVFRLKGRHGRTYALAFGNDGPVLASANHDGTITMWGACLDRFDSHAAKEEARSDPAY